MSQLPTVALALFVGILTSWVFWGIYKHSRRRANSPCPPGPKGYPIVGNIDTPIEYTWVKFAQWTKEYGDVFSLNIFGKNIIVIGSYEAAADLFDKRSWIYSSRINFPMIRDLQVPNGKKCVVGSRFYRMGYSWSVVFMPYGERWTRTRQLFLTYFHQRNIPSYHPTLTRETHALLRRLTETPEDFFEHCRLMFASTILDLAYGLKASGRYDPIIVNGEKVLKTIGEAAVPGRFWVDFMPFLQYLPSWFPWLEFREKAKLWRPYGDIFLHRPWEIVKQRVAEGTARPCFTTQLMQELDTDSNPVVELAYAKPVAAIAYAGGSDTTVATTQSLFLAMCLYPEVQCKAQEELDRVVGPHRLPEFSDWKNLPYMEAFIKEALRWMPVLPLAMPHMNTEDDVFRGYFIPKGSLIIGNSWGILHDEEVYGSATDAFRPERFLNADGTANERVPYPNVAFGFGRRICPGRWLSDASLFITFSSILHAFNISSPVDENGNKIKLQARQGPTLLSEPIKFRCIIKPRSEIHASLVMNTALADFDA
ncbi:cytochrome P450 [Fistulina hepatica ATCC 64428]|uniref:Cytochrome P450 n=1 Tax=Fistulina hepatica ATCC 64428 TaxID=1128425 RepID=A0A0D7AG27_9AGAR|nr:cytochrome P450 [Fistulina hepatica ATCC 64428]